MARGRYKIMIGRKVVHKTNDLKNNKFLVFKDYVKQLHNCYSDYLLQWPFLNKVLKVVDIEPFNMGRYEVGDHFSV